MVLSFFSLSRVKRQLAERKLPNLQVFLYFLIIMAIDNFQLAHLQIVPARPTEWTAYSVVISLMLGAIFLVATWHLNGGPAGKDYLIRYFSLSAVVALWIAIPTQVVILLSNSLEIFTSIPWFNPVFILCTNIAYFGFVAWQIREVAGLSTQMGY